MLESVDYINKIFHQTRSVDRRWIVSEAIDRRNNLHSGRPTVDKDGAP